MRSYNIRYYFMRLFFLMFLTLIPLLVPAQREDVTDWTDNPSVFNRMTQNEGLSSNSVQVIRQDRYGRLWVGTSRGVDVYDGHLVRHRTMGGRNIGVLSMCETDQGIWLGTEAGLYFYSFRSDSIVEFTQETKRGERPDGMIYSICHDSSGQLWLTSYGRGVFCLSSDGRTLVRYPLPNDERRVGHLLVTERGDVWELGAWGDVRLCRLDKKQGHFVHERLETDGHSLFVSGLIMVQGPDSCFYIGNDVGRLLRFRPGQREAEQITIGTDIGIIRSLSFLRPSLLLIGSDAGLTLYDLHTCSAHPFPTSAAQQGGGSISIVYDTFIDREQTLWVGTYYNGLFYTHAEFSNFRSFDLQGVLRGGEGCMVGSFAEDDDGRVWIGSDGGGLAFYEPSDGHITSAMAFEKETGTSPTHLPTHVRSLYYQKGKLMVGTYTEGLSFYDTRKHTISHYPRFLDEQGNEVESTAQCLLSADSMLWMGSYSLIGTFDFQKQCVHVQREGTSPVNSLCRTPDGRLWFATASQGVLSYNPRSNRWQTYRISQTENGKNEMCNYICADAKGQLWVGTSNGLFFLSEGSNSFRSVSLPLTSPLEVLGIVCLDDHLWMTTSDGIVHFSTATQGVEQVFRTAAGLTNIDFISGSIFQTSDGNILVGTSTGFVVFNPRKMRINSVPPCVKFTDISVAGKTVMVGSETLSRPIIEGGTIRLNYRESTIRIHFSAMSLVHPQNNRYQYRLEGFDDTWNDAGNYTFATYPHLPPGTYTFHVRGTNNDGVWSEDDATLTIVVTPPFYWNTFAQIIYILLLLTVLTFWIRWLLRRRDRRHRAVIEQINTQKQIDIHEARIQFMTISEQDSEFLRKVENVIEQHYTESITVEQIAAEVGISRSGLFSRLKAISDATPNEMIQMIRLRHAEALLRTGRYRVNEVCYKVGFSSPSYFSKCFQKQYGCTPAEYNK